MRHGTCFRRRLATHRAGAAPHSAVAELGVVRRIRYMSSQRFFLAVALVSLVLPGCVTSELSAANPGFSRREIHALVKTYDWKSDDPDDPARSYSDHELSELLNGLVYPSPEGEFAPAAPVAVALAAVGDERFALALSKQPRAVQRDVFEIISCLWTYYGLRYPKTQKLLHKYA